MFPRYLQYLLTDFRQTFVTGASWDRDDPITFWGQKVKVQGHTIAAEQHSTLPSSATFSSLSTVTTRADEMKFAFAQTKLLKAKLQWRTQGFAIGFNLPLAFRGRRELAR